MRDTAIIRLLLDSGGRLGEISALTVKDIDFDMDVAHAIGKGPRLRVLPFGDKTGAALARYLRTRTRERHAGRPELWLAEKNKGTLLAGGIKQMLKRRGKAMTPPIPGLHAYMFRHTAAHRWMAEGASETDLMRIMGWRSPRCSDATVHQPLTSGHVPRTRASGSATWSKRDGVGACHLPAAVGGGVRHDPPPGRPRRTTGAPVLALRGGARVKVARSAAQGMPRSAQRLHRPSHRE